MSKEKRFFSSLRLIMAISPSKMDVGGIPRMVIEDDFLPEIKREIKRERDLGKKEELQELYDLWEKYSDPKTREGKSWTTAALKILSRQANEIGYKNNNDQKEFAATAAHIFLKGKKIDVLEGYDYENGPDGLMGLWLKSIRWAGQDAQDKTRKYREKMREMPTDDEGREFDAPDTGQTEAEWEISTADAKEIVKDMGKWVKRKLGRDDAAVTLYNMYEQMAKRKGAFSKIKPHVHLFDSWSEATGLSSPQSLSDKMEKIQKLQLQFLRDEAEFPINRQTMRKIGIIARVEKRFYEINCPQKMRRAKVAARLLELYYVRS